MRHPLLALAGFLLLTSAAQTAGPTEWPRFRGPDGSGVADGSTLPDHWTVSDPRKNVAWVAEIPGRGWSSPIRWHGRVFVTSAISSGAFKAPS